MRRNIRSYSVKFSESVAAWFTPSSSPRVRLLLLPLTVNLFLVSASQGDCLWRSSLKVPRVTRLLSDCCSQIREPLVSSEDRDNDGHTLWNTVTNTHPSGFVLLTWSRHHDNRQSFHFTPCLHVYINGCFSFYQCGSCSVDYDVLSVEVFCAFSKARWFFPCLLHKWSAISSICTAWIMCLQVL